MKKMQGLSLSALTALTLGLTAAPMAGFADDVNFDKSTDPTTQTKLSSQTDKQAQGQTHIYFEGADADTGGLSLLNAPSFDFDNDAAKHTVRNAIREWQASSAENNQIQVSNYVKNSKGYIVTAQASDLTKKDGSKLPVASLTLNTQDGDTVNGNQILGNKQAKDILLKTDQVALGKENSYGTLSVKNSEARMKVTQDNFKPGTYRGTITYTLSEGQDLNPAD
ncbi:WxL domain-containing protein [Leuconostocaceae bacterium ESL0958]|nr:WxL domain-containing protein [Leuconostocaceae bacterium ESL0958]